jgi:xanthine/CO dehydrogenase XdhC/CoxF family maturation factor
MDPSAPKPYVDQEGRNRPGIARKVRAVRDSAGRRRSRRERMTGRISVILAEDHAIVRHGLRLLLESEPDITVVGETSDGLEVAALVERLGPDVLVLDIVCPASTGWIWPGSSPGARWPRAS